MTPEDYTAFTRTTARYPHEAALEILCLGLTAEAGEVADRCKRVKLEGILTAEARESFLCNIGDTLWFCTRLLDELGYTLEDAFAHNVHKLTARKENGTLLDEHANDPGAYAPPPVRDLVPA